MHFIYTYIYIYINTVHIYINICMYTCAHICMHNMFIFLLSYSIRGPMGLATCCGHALTGPFGGGLHTCLTLFCDADGLHFGSLWCLFWKPWARKDTHSMPLVPFGQIWGGSGTPQSAKWCCHLGRNIALLESRMPDWRAQGFKIPPKVGGKTPVLGWASGYQTWAK